MVRTKEITGDTLYSVALGNNSVYDVFWKGDRGAIWKLRLVAFRKALA